MEKQNQQKNEPQREVMGTGKQRKPYEPPKAEFVPLRIEKRLFGSGTDYFKLLTSCQPPPTDSGSGCGGGIRG
jgi:hypothetical protein